MRKKSSKVIGNPEVYHSSLDGSTIAKFETEGANRNYFRCSDNKHTNAGAKALLELGVPMRGITIKVAGSGDKALRDFFER